MSSIEIKDLSMSYGKIMALEDVNLVFEANKIYGLLGRNGAGKTTLLNLITNKIFATKGEIKVDEESVTENDRVLQRIFYMMERNLYPEVLKVKRIFKWSKEFYPSFDMNYALTLSDRFGLNVNKRIKELSTGYTSIFKAILALSSNADILIFDEPVLGLDANHRDMFYKEMIANYSAKPKTIIISTHLIEEVANVLENAVIIKDGKIISNQPVEELLDTAYIVSGVGSKVDCFIKDKKFIGAEMIGKFKSVTVLEKLQNGTREMAKELELDINRAELQKLFISLTNS